MGGIIPTLTCLGKVGGIIPTLTCVGKVGGIIPTLTCLGIVGGIKLDHHIFATIVYYLRKLLYILEERIYLNLLLMLTMDGSIAGSNKLNEEEPHAYWLLMDLFRWKFNATCLV